MVFLRIEPIHDRRHLLQYKIWVSRLASSIEYFNKQSHCGWWEKNKYTGTSHLQTLKCLPVNVHITILMWINQLSNQHLVRSFLT